MPGVRGRFLFRPVALVAGATSAAALLARDEERD